MSSGRIRQRMMAAAHDGVEVDLDLEDAPVGWREDEGGDGAYIIRWALPNGKRATVLRYTASAARTHIELLLKQTWCGEIDLLWVDSVGSTPVLQQSWGAKKPAPAREPQREGGTPLAELLLDTTETWPDSRLRVWSHRLPLLLLATPTGARIDLEGYPRQGGPPTEQQLDDVAHWGVVAEIADGGEFQWLALANWALRHLYPVYQRRFTHDHPCAERVAWLHARLPYPSPKEIHMTTSAPSPSPPTSTRAPIDLVALRQLGAVVRLQGRDYLTHDGLLRLAHDHGLQEVSTNIVSWDAAERAAVVTATVTGERGRYTGIGDACPQNVGRHIAGATLRMAETRAVNRALRLYLGLGMTTAEELPGRIAEDGDEEPTVSSSLASGGAEANDPATTAWTQAEQQKFVAALQALHLSLGEVERYLSHEGQTLPGDMSLEERRRLYQWLKTQGGAKLVRTSGRAA